MVRKTRTETPVNESKEEKFKRLAEKRMSKILKEFKGIMNLSSPAYASTPEQQEKMITALKLKVMDVEKSFQAQKKIDTGFTL